MSPFLHILSRQPPSWLSGWLTVKFHACALRGVLRAPHASTWHLVPFYLCLDDIRPLQAERQSEVPLLSTVVLWLPLHPANISLSNLLLTTIQGVQMDLLQARPEGNQDHLDGMGECLDPSVPWHYLGSPVPTCILGSQHPLQAGFPDTISSRKSLGSTWLSLWVLAHVSPEPNAVYSSTRCFSALLAKIKYTQSFRSFSSGPSTTPASSAPGVGVTVAPSCRHTMDNQYMDARGAAHTITRVYRGSQLTSPT